jgi:peptidoglycan hydrolase CwlO-like protein
MDYDELVSSLLDADEFAGGGTIDGKAADAIVQLQAQVATRNVAMNTLAKECESLQTRVAELTVERDREQANVYTMVESCKRAEADLAELKARLQGG